MKPFVAAQRETKGIAMIPEIEEMNTTLAFPEPFRKGYAN